MLTSAPKLSELLDAPERLPTLRREVLLELRRQTLHFLAELEHQVALAPPGAPSPAAQDGQEDRLLSPDEAAAYLGRTRRWIKRHGPRLPGRVKLSPKAIGYRLRDLERYVQRKATK
jgi:predicted DNA-binding transcriptional regulator AlpA